MTGPTKWPPILACMTAASLWLMWSNGRPPRAVPPALVPGLRQVAEPTQLQRPGLESVVNPRLMDRGGEPPNPWGHGDVPHASDRRGMDTSTHPAILVPSPAIPMEEYDPGAAMQDDETR